MLRCLFTLWSTISLLFYIKFKDHRGQVGSNINIMVNMISKKVHRSHICFVGEILILKSSCLWQTSKAILGLKVLKCVNLVNISSHDRRVVLIWCGDKCNIECKYIDYIWWFSFSSNKGQTCNTMRIWNSKTGTFDISLF